MKLPSIIIASLISIFACRHDKIEVENSIYSNGFNYIGPICNEIVDADTCDIYDELCIIDITIDPKNEGHYYHIAVNPENENQIACLRWNLVWPFNCQLIIYDVLSKNLDTLYQQNAFIIGNLAWGRNGWLAFTHGPGQIDLYNTYLHTSSTSVVITSMNNFYYGACPVWSPDGNLLLYTEVTLPPDYIGNGYLINTRGEIVDTLPKFAQTDWHSNGKIISTAGTGFAIYDTATEVSDTISYGNIDHENDKIHYLKWLPDGIHAVYSRYRGIFRINTITGETICIKDRCSTRIYNSISIPPNAQFMYVEKKSFKRISTCFWQYETEIWKMDFNGCNEERVVFDE